MKIKDGFMLRDIAGSWIVVPLGNRVVDFNGLLSLNNTGALLWKRLQTDVSREDLLTAILDAYPIDANRAERDLDDFLATLEKYQLVE